MSQYVVYFLGLAIVGVWLYSRPHHNLKTLFILWWVGLLLETQFIPSLVAYLLYKAGLHGVAPARTAVFAALKWAGGIIMLRVLLGLTLWERPCRPREYILAALFITSLALPPLVRHGERLLVLTVGPVAYMRTSDWVLAIIALPWLWWFGWRRSLHAKWQLVAVITCVVSFVVLVANLDFSLTLDGGTAKLVSAQSLRFGNYYSWDSIHKSGFLSLAWQAKEHCEIYALFLIMSLVYEIHVCVRRISRRMVVSHLLAALIPAGLAILFMVILAALSLATYRVSAAARYPARLAAEMRACLARQLALTGDVKESAFAVAGPGGIVVVRQGKTIAHVAGAPFTSPSLDSLLVAAEPTRAGPLLLIGGDVFLRARLDTLMDGVPLRVEACMPIDSAWVQGLSDVVGRPVRLHPEQVVAGSGFSWEVSQPAAGPIGPISAGGHAVPGLGMIACLWWDGNSLQEATVTVSSDASLGESVISRRSLDLDSLFALLQLMLLWLIAVSIMIAVWWIGATVFRMGKNISRAVGALTAGTDAVGRGELSHRIAVEGRDELWSVAASFNRMAEGLERTRGIELAKERLEKELEAVDVFVGECERADDMSVIVIQRQDQCGNPSA